jgi:hypothetical protein
MEQIKVKDLFTAAKRVIAEYKEREMLLNQQERELNAELHVLQEEITSNMLAQEIATIPERVYLKIEAKKINQKTDIIKVLLDELAEERTALKLEFVPKYRDAMNKAYPYQYSAVKIAEKYKYLMLEEIGSIGVQMQDQFRVIERDINEIFKDEKVVEQFPRLKYAYEYDRFVPSFSWFNDSVVSKNEVFSACRGYRPTKPKHMEEVEETNKEKDVE